MIHSPRALDLLVRKLETYARLTPDDRGALLDLPFTLRVFEPNDFIIREGEPPAHCGVLLLGYVFRQKLAGSGDRQIVSLHIPGEPLDFQGLLLARADHSVQALTKAEIAIVPRAAMQALVTNRPGIAAAALTYCVVEASISREWTLNVGRRDARTRLAHLLCEFAVRLAAQGLAGNDGYTLPMTQEQLGDALGLTSVHVNRTLRAMEADGVIGRNGRDLSFPDLDVLRREGDFDPLYLHMERMAA